MNPREVAADALGLPLRQVEFVRALPGGSTNSSALLHADGLPVVVRIARGGSADLGIDRKSEAASLAAARAAGLGPEVLACNPATGLLITRQLAGRPWRDEDVRARTALARLGAWFAALHALARPAGVRVLHLPAYVAGLEAKVPGGLPLRLRTFARTASEALASSADSFCHNDVHAANVFDDGSLTLIDWEFAGVGVPEFDLAGPVCYHRLIPDERESLYAGYRASGGLIDRARLGLACWLFDYVACLWELLIARGASEPALSVAGLQQSVPDRLQHLARTSEDAIEPTRTMQRWWD